MNLSFTRPVGTDMWLMARLMKVVTYLWSFDTWAKVKSE